MGILRSFAVAGTLAVAALAAFAVAGCKRSPPPNGEPLHVAAAADLADAFPEVGKAFEKETGRPVSFSFGATGLLAKQVEEGAPFDVFAAANQSFVDDVVKAGVCQEDTKTLYAEGRIVLWTRGDGGVSVGSLADLTRPEVIHVAIANPDHAPYGKAAKQALVKGGVWDAIEKKIVYGENVQQTLQFAQSGNADVAIVALSLATVSGGRATPIEPALHDPLRQTLVVCRGAAGSQGRLEPDARRFAVFVGSGDGRTILKKYGFLREGDVTAIGAARQGSPNEAARQGTPSR
jgi:molybdate transport system substrate-binding protein